MANSTTQITAAPAVGAAATLPALAGTPAPSVRRKPGLAYKVLQGLASLKITVVLFALSIVLVFAGTLAQVDANIWTVVGKYFRCYYVWIPLQIFFPRTFGVGGGFPFPGGWLLGTLLLINLLAAHAIRFKLSAKRSGIILLHAGVVVIMVSELVTGLFAVEGSMIIYPNSSSNYAMSPRETELAVIAEGAGDQTEVVAIPLAKLHKAGETIQSDLLPFDIEIVQYMVNCDLCKLQEKDEFLSYEWAAMLPLAPKGTPNPATAGFGANTFVALPAAEVGGVEQNKEDRAAAYIRLKDKKTGKDLGTYLVSVFLQDAALMQDIPQYVIFEGKRYDVRLRLARAYKPYTVHLLKFTHEVYEGTGKPKNFCSTVRLVDPTKGEDRRADISMNDPLRYGGETFYQQSFLEGDRGTILQIVRNPGWLMPYIACIMVAIGMGIHFGITLVTFLERRKSREPMHFTLKHLLPSLIAVTIAGMFIAVVMVQPGDAKGGMHIQDAARLPVVEGGRVMPLDTVARNSLMIISGRQSYVDDKGNRYSATKWLLDVVATKKPDGPAMDEKVFRIENDQVRGLLQLKPRDGLRYSYGEIGQRIDAFKEQLQRVDKVPAKDRDLYDAKLAELFGHIKLFHALKEGIQPRVIPPTKSSGEWQSFEEIVNDFQQRAVHANGAREIDPALEAYATMLFSYAKDNSTEFNESLRKFQELIQASHPPGAEKVGFETFFNHFAPFYQCTILYVFVLLLACISWVAFPKQLAQAAFALACLTLVVHTFALFGRMYLMGRPLVFVTNLYSSAVFIGWVAVILGLVLERIFKNTLGIVVAAVIGAATLLIGHYLATTGDTLEMMQAVLDTNFWLATHVTTVTMGYASTVVAGILGWAFIGLRVSSQFLYEKLFKTIGKMIYGIVCFAMLFSFVGTVLGGIWADQSWGRFWGWDPKENGALLIVLWNALILHARWGGMVQQRGVAVLAVAGNIMTGWSWFGVNMLGVGLHSYGFMDGAVFWLLAWVVFNLGVIALGILPTEWLPTWTQVAKPRSVAE